MTLSFTSAIRPAPRIPPHISGVFDPTKNHFTGKERDTESGNDYMFARYYNSATGRFLSPDWDAKSSDPVPYAKLDNPQTLNLYAYVDNNPIGTSDLDGHGDWYDASGNSLGSDGVNDNRVLIVQSKNDVTKNNGKIDAANSGTPMYSVSSAESDAIATSVANTDTPILHEEGFTESATGDIHADRPGSAPGQGANEAPFNHDQPVTDSTRMEEHTHWIPQPLPVGALGGSLGTTTDPQPSSTDRNAASQTPNTIHVEANRVTTYFYGQRGEAHVPTTAFRKAPKKKKSDDAEATP